MSSACVQGCQTQLQFSCYGTDTLHLCQQISDCAGDAQNPNCCQLQGGQYACVSNQVKMYGNLTCL